MVVIGEEIRNEENIGLLRKENYTIGTHVMFDLHPQAELIQNGATIVPTYRHNPDRTEHRKLVVSGTIAGLDSKMVALVPVWDRSDRMPEDISYIGGVNVYGAAILGWHRTET